MTTNLHGQRPIAMEALGAIPVAGEIEHLVGVTKTTLTRPTGMKTLVLHVEAGAFRAQLGAGAGLTGAAPGASVTDGTGSLKLAAGSQTVLPAPATITVIGTSASDVLTYYWL